MANYRTTKITGISLSNTLLKFSKGGAIFSVVTGIAAAIVACVTEYKIGKGGRR